MKRFTTLSALLLALLLLLSGCGGAPAASQSSASAAPEQSAPASSGETGDGGDTSGGPEDTSGDASAAPEREAAGDWRGAYLAELEGLCGRYGRYVREDESEFSAVTGVKYGQLLDFDGDGTRELVVLVDSTVRLYTCRAGEAVLLHQQEVGGRFGQTDVSYTFLVNARSDTPCLAIFHTRDEWSQEAITLVTVSGGGATATELLATASAQGDLPDRADLDDFQIDGQPVSREEYEARRAAAVEGAVEVDRDFGAFPATREQLDLLFAALAGEDGDYVLPNSDAAFLTPEDLSGLTPSRLRLARNEIYARHGRIFQAQDLRDHFEAQPWYLGLYPADTFDTLGDGVFNRYELANLALILSAEGGSEAEAPAAAETGPALSEEEARALAAAHWDFDEDGENIDPETGYPISLISDGLQGAEDGAYYVFRLAWLVDGSHWSTLDWAYVDAQSGGISPTAPEGWPQS